MSSRHIATFVEWNVDRGFGFVEADGERTFVHARDFKERFRLPCAGDRVRFVIGSDKRGRPCAKEVAFVEERGRIGILSLILVAMLLILPSLAVLTLPFDGRWLAAYALAISLVTYFVYSDDKNRARRKAWRVPEAELHFLELIGGWPGAFLAQRRLRHKCSKRSFQVTFWMVVLLFQLTSFDCLADWKHASQAWQAICNLAEPARAWSKG
jgi:uncharacterized membrane protein YsdA (DUF1294 family)/cold shock CspA family protein